MTNRWRIVAARVRALADRRRREREFDEELTDHLERLAGEARAAGATAEEARRDALRRFGGVARTRERWREQLGFAGVEAFWLDLGLAARALARRPLLVATASLSIACGAALNLAVYAAVTRVLFATSLSGAAPNGRLLAITGEISYPNYQDLARLDTFAGVAAMQVTRVAWRTESGTVRVGAKIVSANFFDVVGVRPALGRTFDGRDADGRTAVLGFDFWRRRFGADPAVLGRTLTLNGWPYIVVGVTPGEFNAPVAPMVASDVYLPIGPQVCLGLGDRAAPQFDLVARLQDGVTAAQARGAVAAAAADLERQYPTANARFASAIQIQPAAGLGFWRGLLGGALPLALAAASTLYAIVGLVLLAACANVAGLLLARAEERKREMAVCAALGATRWRLAQRYLAESAILAAAGTALAAVLYEIAATAITRLAWTSASLTLTLPGLPLGYLVAVACAITVACAAAPALTLRSTTAAATLRSASAQNSARSRSKTILVVAQVAICAVLLSGASILFHDVARMRHADPGFDTAQTIAIEVRSATDASGFRLRPFERARAVVSRLPAVQSISSARSLPLMFLTWRAAARVDGDGAAPRRIDIVPVGPRYFETLRIPLLRGRDLADRDLRFLGSGPTPIVINQTFAERFFAAVDPIGRTIVVTDDARGGADRALIVAGVARDSKTRSLDEEAHPVVYLPEAGDFLLVRVNGPAAAAARAIETALWSAGAFAWVDAQPLQSQIELAQRPARFGGAALAALGLIGLTIAMVGLYAIVSYEVNRRRFEIAIRLAVGASQASVLRLIVGDGLAVVAAGCAIGIGVAQLVLRALAPLVRLNRGRFDPLALTAVAITMALVGAAASFAPARRASRVNPAVALRHD